MRKIIAALPEDWPSHFTKHLNAGDLDAVIGTKPTLQSRVVRAVTVGDFALVYTDFEGLAVDEMGKTSDAS